MEIIFDPAKSLKNDIERGLPFEKANEFDWDTAVTTEDKRFPYSELRFLTYGLINYRVYAICFTPLKPSLVRVISFRKANKREVNRYEKVRKEEAANQPRW
jgi:uncharacterized DUF497 family protein